MTREEAIKSIKLFFSGLRIALSNETKEAFNTLIPELAESEDEKIRKELIELVGLVPDYMFGEIKPNKFIAYLEKQKEHQNNSDAPNESSWSGMISSSDKDKDLDEIAQDYVDRVKEYNPEPTWDLMQTAVCYGYYLAEQKEQKPDDDPLDDPKFIKGFDTGREVQRIFDEQKPAEWSEKDENCLKYAIDGLERYIKEHPDPEFGNATPCEKAAVRWLKSLRPSWKPSEEQMYILNWVANILLNHDGIVEEEVSKKLQSLYNDLKKLM